ncbi:hypothetical protein ACI7YT_12215 [Microbacterium sp. M]|uniref:hypothetical protein n=1 Tax=Microbacterium sp. M TaxID=3377125 RepID=UPI0038682BF9
MGKKSAEFEAFEEEIVEEAREGYDLRDRLRNRLKRTKTVTVYTDDIAGSELGGAEDSVDAYGIRHGRRRWGIKGELDRLGEVATDLERRLVNLTEILDENPDDAEAAAQRAEVEAHIATLAEKVAAEQKKITPLLKRLEKTSLQFTLRTIPDLVIRDARRKAKRNLGIKGKIPEVLLEEFNLEHVAILVAASVESWEDKGAKQKFTSLTVEEARALRDELPVGQFTVLDKAIGELSFEAQISNLATDSADF